MTIVQIIPMACSFEGSMTAELPHNDIPDSRFGV